MSPRTKPLTLIVFLFAVTVSASGWIQSASAQAPVAADQNVVDDLMRRVEFLENELARVQQQPSAPTPAFGLASWQNVTAEENAPCTSCQTSGSSCGAGCCSCGICRCHGFRSCQCPLQPMPCIECPRTSTLSPFSNLHFFGALKLDMIFSDPRPFSPGSPFFLGPAPLPGRDQNIVSIHARQSTIGAAYTGPQFCGFQAGGTIIAMFFNDSVIADRYGLLPLQAFGELKNEDWRFAAGLQFDVFSPGIPTVLPFSALAASGNAGNSFRGQVRLERFLHVNERKQWTLQAALSEPINSTIDPTFRVSEDNGWPNVEARVALGLGSIEGVGPTAKRPFEIGASGLVGPASHDGSARQSSRRGRVGPRGRLPLEDDRPAGFHGRVLHGPVARYLQRRHPPDHQCRHADRDPLDRRLDGDVLLLDPVPAQSHRLRDRRSDRQRHLHRRAALGRTYNRRSIRNWLWDLNNVFRVGVEFTWRQTNYAVLPDNEGPGFHTQFQWVF